MLCSKHQMHHTLRFRHLSEHRHDMQWWQVYSGLLPRSIGYRGRIKSIVKEFVSLKADMWMEKCCVKTATTPPPPTSTKCTTPDGSGVCQNTGTTCSGGHYVAGYCPGATDIQVSSIMHTESQVIWFANLSIVLCPRRGTNNASTTTAKW